MHIDVVVNYRVSLGVMQIDVAVRKNTVFRVLWRSLTVLNVFEVAGFVVDVCAYGIEGHQVNESIPLK
jgi:hypothetical protein